MTFEVKPTDSLPIVGAIATYLTLNEWVAVLTIIFTILKIVEWTDNWIAKRRRRKEGRDWEGI